MLSKIKRYTVAILIVVLAVVFTLVSPAFATVGNFFNLLRQVAILGIIAAGMTPVILTGEVDISVGSVLSFTSCVIAILIVNAGVSPVLACLVGVCVATVALLVNSAVIVGTGMPSMLGTLAAMQIYAGLSYHITNAKPVTGLPEGMKMLGQGYVGVVPVPVIIAVVALAVVGFVLSRTEFGRQIYAVGSNREAARLSGVPVTKVLLASFALCGALVGLASCVQLSRLSGGFPTAGSGLEMEALTAVVVGGVSFAGGRGKVSGVAQGVLLMGVLQNGLAIMGLSTYMQDICKGLVLALVVGVDCWQRNHHAKAPRQQAVADA